MKSAWDKYKELVEVAMREKAQAQVTKILWRHIYFEQQNRTEQKP